MGAPSSRTRAARQTINTNRTVKSSEPTSPAAPLSPATHEDDCRWGGFCEIESEPALFNAMLKRFGIRGVKVQEVVSLDDDILAFLPKPVYGLIFLFKWAEEDAEKQDRSCPEGVWFANQTINNACASVALINIANNVPGVDLGEHLMAFKHFTKDFSPALRGDAIGNFAFVKDIHNSFARKMDMLHTDLLLKNEVIAKHKGKKYSADENNVEAGFHFIAFMPIGNKLWKLDGLERQPLCLDCVEKDWLSQVKPDLEARMARYEEGQIEFAILSLGRDPLLDMRRSLSQNIRSINALTARMDDVAKPETMGTATQISTLPGNGEADGLLTTADPAFGLSQEQIDQAEIPNPVVTILSGSQIEEMLEAREYLIVSQTELRKNIREEVQASMADEEKALSRGRDIGARMQNFARMVKDRAQ